MKRTFAAVVLLAALGVLLKLGLKKDAAPALIAAEGPANEAAVDPEVALLARHPADKDLVRRVYGEFRQNALSDREDRRPPGSQVAGCARGRGDLPL